MEGQKQVPSEPGKLQQIIAALVINLSALTYGTMVGWPSPMAPQLQSPNPPVGRDPMTDEAASWLGGILCIGALIGTPVFGVIAEKYGRKLAGCLVALPLGVSWLLTIFAMDQNYLFVARFFSGVGGAGALLVCPLYVSEIASDNIRGMLGSLLVLFINLGVLVSYVVGTLVSFRVFAICALVLPLVFLGGFIFMPETPSYLVRCDRMSEAARSLVWLRGGDKVFVDRELASLRASAKEALAETRKASYMDLFKSRGTIRGVIIALGLLGGQQLCGIFAMVNYAATIFKTAGTSLSPDMASIIVGAIQFGGSYLSTTLMERAGRRLLILISCAGMFVCHLILGSFSYLQSNGYEVASFSWVPIVALSVYVITYCLGMGPAPFVVASEVFSPEIAGLATTISLLFLWLVAFVVLKFFVTLSILLGIHGCFFIFAGFCACTFVFTLVLVPETKGRTLDSILVELNGSAGVCCRETEYISQEGILHGSSEPKPEQV